MRALPTQLGLKEECTQMIQSYFSGYYSEDDPLTETEIDTIFVLLINNQDLYGGINGDLVEVSTENILSKTRPYN